VPYDSTVPQSGQTLGNTQSPIQTNFSIITTAQSVNHVTYDDADQGKHKFLQMPEQISAPSTAANEGALYTKVDTASVPKTQLFYRNESNGTEVQLTGFGGSIATILTGTATINASTLAITGALPQNVYGYIIMWSTTTPFPIQMGSFFTDTTQAHGYSNRIVRNSSANDNPVELINDPAADLKLYGTRDDFGSLTINWRLHYWAQ
jgi:hypothetical protein